jgi:hypothetical protein
VQILSALGRAKRRVALAQLLRQSSACSEQLATARLTAFCTRTQSNQSSPSAIPTTHTSAKPIALPIK